MAIKLVMLPGMDGTGELFGPLIRSLPAAFEPLIIRYPQSTACSYAQHADLVSKLLPEDEKYILLAESFAGPIACLIAADPPPNLAGTVLVSSFLEPPRPCLLNLIKALPIKMLKHVAQYDLIARTFLLGKHAKPSVHRLLRQTMAAIDPEVMRHRLSLVGSVDLLDTKVGLPCLVIIASKDRLIRKHNHDAFESVFAQLTMFKVEGPHFLLQAAPAFCARLLEAQLGLFGLEGHAEGPDTRCH